MNKVWENTNEQTQNLFTEGLLRSINWLSWVTAGAMSLLFVPMPKNKKHDQRKVNAS